MTVLERILRAMVEIDELWLRAWQEDVGCMVHCNNIAREL